MSWQIGGSEKSWCCISSSEGSLLAEFLLPGGRSVFFLLRLSVDWMKPTYIMESNPLYSVGWFKRWSHLKSTFKETSRTVLFNQISGYCGLAKLTHEINHHRPLNWTDLAWWMMSRVLLIFLFPCGGESSSWLYWSIDWCLGITNSTKSILEVYLQCIVLTTPTAGVVDWAASHTGLRA